MQWLEDCLKRGLHPNEQVILAALDRVAELGIELAAA
jgi:hypothetical protein